MLFDATLRKEPYDVDVKRVEADNIKDAVDKAQTLKPKSWRVTAIREVYVYEVEDGRTV